LVTREDHANVDESVLMQGTKVRQVTVKVPVLRIPLDIKCSSAENVVDFMTLGFALCRSDLWLGFTGTRIRTQRKCHDRLTFVARLTPPEFSKRAIQTPCDLALIAAGHDEIVKRQREPREHGYEVLEGVGVRRFESDGCVSHFRKFVPASQVRVEDAFPTRRQLHWLGS